MGVNELSILGFLISLASGCGIVVRRTRCLPGPAVICGGCGRPATDVADFACSGCDRDVRAGGLVVGPSGRLELFGGVIGALIVTAVVALAVGVVTQWPVIQAWRSGQSTDRPTDVRRQSVTVFAVSVAWPIAVAAKVRSRSPARTVRS